MWKKDDAKPEGVSSIPATPASPVTSSFPANSSSPSLSGALPASSRAAACISQGIKIKGELSGSEDLFVDGVVEGKLTLTTNSCLTIGPERTREGGRERARSDRAGKNRRKSYRPRQGATLEHRTGYRRSANRPPGYRGRRAAPWKSRGRKASQQADRSQSCGSCSNSQSDRNDFLELRNGG